MTRILIGAILHFVEAIRLAPYGWYSGSVADTVYMQANIRSITEADVDILIKIPKTNGLVPISGWSQFTLTNAPISFGVDTGSFQITFLPAGTNSHPIAERLVSVLSGFMKLKFPMTGEFNPIMNTITYKFGILSLLLKPQYNPDYFSDLTNGSTVHVF